VKDRVILAVKFTSADSGSQVRRAVGGFLRYVQHRDLHPTQAEGRPKPEVSGLLNYVAYRDAATTRAELFGPSGTLSSTERKAFASFVAGAIEGSRPQLYLGRNGETLDRRRAVYRMVISPERASGLDLRKLATAAVTPLEQECGTRLRWIAAVHRNTAHHHVHLVVAGMREDGHGGFVRVDITKPRLTAMKTALGAEISRQREERAPSRQPVSLRATSTKTDVESHIFVVKPSRAAIRRCAAIPTSPASSRGSRTLYPARHVGSVIALRAVARRYQWRMERELEESARDGRRELAA
jgi:hypothetical protein